MSIALCAWNRVPPKLSACGHSALAPSWTYSKVFIHWKWFCPIDAPNSWGYLMNQHMYADIAVAPQKNIIRKKTISQSICESIWVGLYFSNCYHPQPPIVNSSCHLRPLIIGTWMSPWHFPFDGLNNKLGTCPSGFWFFHRFTSTLMRTIHDIG